MTDTIEHAALGGDAGEREALTTVLVALAEAGISPDVQELLVHGNPLRGVAPNALGKALAALRTTDRPVGDMAVQEDDAIRVFAREAVLTVLHNFGNWPRPHMASNEQLGLAEEIAREVVNAYKGRLAALRTMPLLGNGEER